MLNILDLQGIGSFLLDKSIIIDEDSNKKHQEIGIEGVSFESNAATKEDPELVSFISSYTGKIKALASADLNSHLELAKQFMNIGKPFLFECTNRKTFRTKNKRNKAKFFD